MDPNENLREQEWQINEIARLGAANLPSTGNRDRLTYLRKVLRGWLAGGGFQPNWDDYPERVGLLR